MSPVFYIDPRAAGDGSGLTPANAFRAMPAVIVVGARYVFLSELHTL